MTDWFDAPDPEPIDVRAAVPADALCASMLAIQVFLDTYADEGIPPDIAREAFGVHSPEAYSRCLADPARSIHLAERRGAVVGLVDIALGKPCPVGPGGRGPASEVRHLYVQRPFLRQGLGRRLLGVAERVAADRGDALLWLDAWVGNAPALSFYRAMGYEDIGAVDHVIEGQAFENRVFARRLVSRGMR